MAPANLFDISLTALRQLQEQLFNTHWTESMEVLLLWSSSINSSKPYEEIN